MDCNWPHGCVGMQTQPRELLLHMPVSRHYFSTFTGRPSVWGPFCCTHVLFNFVDMDKLFCDLLCIQGLLPAEKGFIFYTL